MNRFKVIILCSLLPMLASCASPGLSTLSYLPPQQQEFKNSVVSESSFEEVWSGLVRELSKSFFVINNVEKPSRIINLSFSLDGDISEYVDCGRSKREFKSHEEERTYDYAVSSPSDYKFTDGLVFQNYWHRIWAVKRGAELTGRINVFVAPSEGGTEVAANVRYIVEFSQSGRFYLTHVRAPNRPDPYMAQEEMPVSTAKISFNTGSVGKSDASPPVVCASTGALEKSILELVDP
jgi:hypothetical protein